MKLKERVAQQREERERQENLAKQAESEIQPPVTITRSTKPTSDMDAAIERAKQLDPLETIARGNVPTPFGAVLSADRASEFDDLISFEEVCRQLNVNWSWLKLWVQTRLLTAVRSRESPNRFLVSVKHINGLLEHSAFGPKRVALPARPKV